MYKQMQPLWAASWYIFTYIIATIWVYIDAKSRGSSSAAFWSPFVFLITPLLLYYLLYYRRKIHRTRLRTRSEKATAITALAATLSTLSVMIIVPPDPIVQIQRWCLSFIIAIPGSYLVYKKLTN